MKKYLTITGIGVGVLVLVFFGWQHFAQTPNTPSQHNAFEKQNAYKNILEKCLESGQKRFEEKRRDGECSVNLCWSDMINKISYGESKKIENYICTFDAFDLAPPDDHNGDWCPETVECRKN